RVLCGVANSPQVRSRSCACAVIRLVDDLPGGRAADVIGNQLLRAGTAVGTNSRSAGGARSRREFAAKMGIVEEEAEEAQFWLDLVAARGFADADRVGSLRDEAGQPGAIAVPSIRTARRTPRSIPHSAFPVPRSSSCS